MHLTDHISDVQLNEYLDNESKEHDAIESHLAVCADCAARFAALQSLFTELDLLPDMELSHSLAARFMTQPSLASQPPAWLTLTATLQAVVAVLALVVASPFVIRLLPVFPTLSIADLLLKAESLWLGMLALLASFRFPTLPQLALPQLPNLVLASVLLASSLLWLVGNGLLLKRPA